MKKIKIFLLALLCAISLSLVSCGKKELPPTELYEKIIDKEMKAAKTSFVKSQALDKLKMKYQLTLSLEDSGKSYVSEMLDGIDLSWFKNAGLGLDFAIADEKMTMDINASVNKGKINGNVYLDKEQLVLRIPELNTKYLSLPTEVLSIYGGMDIASYLESYFEYMKTGINSLSELKNTVDTLESIWKKYVIAKDVSYGEKIEIAGISQSCAKLTVELAEENLKNCLSDLLTLLETDEYLVNLLESMSDLYDAMGVDIYSELLGIIDELSYEIKTGTFDGEGLQMDLFVDDNYDVIGRKIYLLDDYDREEIFSMELAKDKGKYGFEMAISDLGKIQSTGTVKGSTYSGSCSIYETYEEEIFSFDLNKFDISKIADGKIAIKATFDLPEDADLPDESSVCWDMSSDTKKATATLTLFSKNKPLGNLKCDVTTQSGSAINEPKDVVTMDDERAIADYITDLQFDNIKKVVKDIGMSEEYESLANTAIDQLLLAGGF